MTNENGDEDVFDLEVEGGSLGPSPLSDMPSSSLLVNPWRKLSPTSNLFSFPECLTLWVTLPLAPALVVFFFFLAIVLPFLTKNGTVSYRLQIWSDWLLVYTLISAIEFLVIIHWFPWLFWGEAGT